MPLVFVSENMCQIVNLGMGHVRWRYISDINHIWVTISLGLSLSLFFILFPLIFCSLSVVFPDTARPPHGSLMSSPLAQELWYLENYNTNYLFVLTKRYSNICWNILKTCCTWYLVKLHLKKESCGSERCFGEKSQKLVFQRLFSKSCLFSSFWDFSQKRLKQDRKKSWFWSICPQYLWIDTPHAYGRTTLKFWFFFGKYFLY